MENEKNLNEKIDKEALDQVAGGARGASSHGYCPYTEDRGCRVESVGTWDNNNEDCKYCGWRAW